MVVRKKKKKESKYVYGYTKATTISGHCVTLYNRLHIYLYARYYLGNLFIFRNFLRQLSRDKTLLKQLLFGYPTRDAYDVRGGPENDLSPAPIEAKQQETTTRKASASKRNIRLSIYNLFTFT